MRPEHKQTEKKKSEIQTPTQTESEPRAITIAKALKEKRKGEWQTDKREDG